jgi:TATA-box binding protein (TBP) (component of TFIID and TFIIIB)
MHVKIFNTGKLEIPGIQNAQTLNYVLEVVTRILRPAVSPDLSYVKEQCDTVLINSNFNCGFYIDRDRLHELLKYKYRINSNYDSCSYPGIQSKFYYVYGREVQNGQQPHYAKTEPKPDFCEISFMIFRTGSVLIVGKCSEEILYTIYNFLKALLEEEYDQIVNRDHDHEGCDNSILIPGSGLLKKQPNSKIQRRIITCSETHSTASC